MPIYLFIYISLNIVERINFINLYKNVTPVLNVLCINCVIDCSQITSDEVIRCHGNNLSRQPSVSDISQPSIAQSIAISNMRYDDDITIKSLRDFYNY